MSGHIHPYTGRRCIAPPGGTKCRERSRHLDCADERIPTKRLSSRRPALIPARLVLVHLFILGHLSRYYHLYRPGYSGLVQPLVHQCSRCDVCDMSYILSLVQPLESPAEFKPGSPVSSSPCVSRVVVIFELSYMRTNVHVDNEHPKVEELRVEYRSPKEHVVESRSRIVDACSSP